MKKIEEVVKDAIDKGAQSVEEVHQTIAKMPLKYLEKMEDREECFIQCELSLQF